MRVCVSGSWGNWARPNWKFLLHNVEYLCTGAGGELGKVCCARDRLRFKSSVVKKEVYILEKKIVILKRDLLF